MKAGTSMTRKPDDILPSSEYQYGFSDKDVSVYNTGKGISKEIVAEISHIKNEPQWMTDYRLKAFESFLKKPMPTWGVDLSSLDFSEYTYYIKPSERMGTTWEEVPETIKDTFERLGIPEAERKFLAGVSTQYESEVVYHNMLKEVEDKGVIFLDTDSALRDHPDLFRKFFGTVVGFSDNKFSALNSAVWSGGSFIYVPPGVKLDKPLQSYFRINTESMGQFERTLIIVDEGADVHYVEGCTAPTYSKDSLHAAVVEIIIHKNAKCRYSTVQNWSTNVLNLVTKRAKVLDHGVMEWIDGNIGSHVTMKYPACILAGEGARGMTISIAVASHAKQIQDAGAKMIHLAPNTQSTIISKSVARNGGEVNYRGLIQHGPNATHAKSHVECDTLILDDRSRSDTLPTNISANATSTIEHEATVSKISEEQLFYLMSRGLTKSQAQETIVMGFLEPFTRELPMEYAVELNQLMRMEMEGSVG
jgi:Fe-S cluster assembly protein SufB